MAENREKANSPAKYSGVLMAVALLLIAGLLAWLYATSEPTTIQVVEDEDEEVVEEADGLALQDFAAAGPRSFVGQEVTLLRVSVDSRLGDEIFWTTIPENQPYLVKIGGPLVAEGRTVSSGERYTVVGTVRAMSDSIVNAWVEQGIIREDQSGEASFATTFIEAQALRRAQR